jgi:hypothetical protein
MKQIIEGAEYEFTSMWEIYVFKILCFWQGLRATHTHIKWGVEWEETYIVKVERPEWTGGIVGKRG